MNRTVVVSVADGLNQRTIDAMYEFRREVFVQRLGWALPQTGSCERDQYDREDTLYFLRCDGEQRVDACARLIPTTRSYMLPELFPQLMGPTRPPRDPTIWELSRFATKVRMTQGGRLLSLSECTVELLSAVLRFAREHGITRLLFVVSIGIERLFLRTGIEVCRLSSPAKVGADLCVALLIDTAAEPRPFQRSCADQGESSGARELRQSKVSIQGCSRALVTRED